MVVLTATACEGKDPNSNAASERLSPPKEQFDLALTITSPPRVDRDARFIPVSALYQNKNIAFNIYITTLERPIRVIFLTKGTRSDALVEALATPIGKPAGHLWMREETYFTGVLEQGSIGDIDRGPLHFRLSHEDADKGELKLAIDLASKTGAISIDAADQAPLVKIFAVPSVGAPTLTTPIDRDEIDASIPTSVTAIQRAQIKKVMLSLTARDRALVRWATTYASLKPHDLFVVWETEREEHASSPAPLPEVASHATAAYRVLNLGLPNNLYYFPETGKLIPTPGA